MRKKSSWARSRIEADDSGPVRSIANFRLSISTFDQRSTTNSEREQDRSSERRPGKDLVKGISRTRGRDDQATKGTRWMPWRQEAKKDVGSCEKRRGAANQALIRRYPNGETHGG